MLSLDDVYYSRGLTIYGDNIDKNLFHYVRDRPRLARSEEGPEFLYLQYRRDITDNPDYDADTKASLGGGLLAFTVDLGVNDDELKEAKKELSRFADGEVRLVPIQFRKGSVRLGMAKDLADQENAPPATPRGLNFFEEVYGATVPSLFGSCRATFAVVLSMEASTLFEAALSTGINPINVIYQVEMLGMRPAFNVRITANYHRVYSELDLEFGAKGQIYCVALGVDIGAAFQRLRDKGVIKVEVLNFTDDADLRKQADAAFEWFKTELLKDFFKSSIEPPQLVKAGNSSTGLLSQLPGLLDSLGTSQTGPSPAPKGEPSKESPTSAPAPKTRSDSVPGASETSAAPTGGGPTGGGVSTSPFQVAFTLKYIEQVEDKERVFEYSMQSAVAREISPQGLLSNVVQGVDLSNAIKKVSLDSEFFNRLLATVSMGGDLNAAGINSVAVNLEYPGERAANEEPSNVDGFIFTPTELTPRTFTNWLNDKKDRRYRYSMDIHFKPDSPYVGKDVHVTTPWEVSRDRQLSLDPLDKIGLLDVEVSLGQIDGAQISQVQVELEYRDEINSFDTQKTIALKPGEPGVHWRVRLSDRNQEAYRYRVSYFLIDGLCYQTDWQTTEEPALVINNPFQNQVKARLVPLLDANNLVEADVNLTYEEPETGYRRTVTKTFMGGVPLIGQDAIIPTLSKTPANFTYDVTVVRGDGSVFATEPQVVTDLSTTLVVSDGEGRTARIRVKLPSTDLASANLSAVKVIVTGIGENADKAEALFTTSNTAEQTLTLVQPGTGPLLYSYEVIGYNPNGIPRNGASGQDTSLNLIVPMPTG